MSRNRHTHRDPLPLPAIEQLEHRRLLSTVYLNDGYLFIRGTHKQDFISIYHPRTPDMLQVKIGREFWTFPTADVQTMRINGGAGDDRIGIDEGGGALFYGLMRIPTRIYGGDGNDSIYGASGRDRIYGGEGNDLIYGGMSGDVIYGEAGDDSIHAGPATSTNIFYPDRYDHAWGGEGNDTLQGSVGNDTLYGDEGDDSISGDTGDDSLSGDDDDDTVHGDVGNDTCLGGNGTDSINGGEGNDSVSGDAGTDSVLGGLGSDTFSNLDDLLEGLDKELRMCDKYGWAVLGGRLFCGVLSNL